MIVLLEFSISSILLVFSLKYLLDIFYHISRYRKYIRQYPGARKNRGRVWKGIR